jgi:hypothetical protein
VTIWVSRSTESPSPSPSSEVARLSQSRQVGVHAVGEHRHEVEPPDHVAGQFRERRCGRDLPRRPHGDGAEGHGPLRHLVVEGGEGDGELLEERVEGREERALHVPVGDLDLGVQVEAVGEPGVQRGGDVAARVVGKAAGGRVHGVSSFSTGRMLPIEVAVQDIGSMHPIGARYRWDAP